MDPSELENRLRSLPLRKPSDDFGTPDRFAEILDHPNQPTSVFQRIKNMPWQTKSIGGLGVAATLLAAYLAFSGSPRNVAFAQVVKALNGATTLSFDSEIKKSSDGSSVSTGKLRR